MYRNLAEQMQDMQKTINRANDSLKPIMNAYDNIFNSPSFMHAMESVQKQAKMINDLYENTPWKQLVEKQLEAEKRVTEALRKIDTTGLINYRNFLRDTFYSEDNQVVEKPNKRIETQQIVESIDIFEKQAEIKKDTETLKVIEDIKTLDLRGNDEFTVFYTSYGNLFLPGNKADSIRITSPKLITLVSALASSNRYIPTRDLAYEAGYASKKTTRNALGILNSKLECLGFKNGKPIDGKQGHGYMMHRNIRLKPDPQEYI